MITDLLVDGLPVFLLPYPPNWQAGVSAEFDVLTSRDTGLTNRENREALAATLRTTLSYRALLNPVEAAALRAALAAWDNRPVLCPFWPSARLAADYALAPVQGTLRVWFEPDWSYCAIAHGNSFPTGAFVPTGDCQTAPLLWGRFVDFPNAVVVTGDDWEEVDFTVTDNGNAASALEPKTTTLTPGDLVNGETPPLVTVPFTWGANSAVTDVRIERGQVGFGRLTSDTFYAQLPRSKSTLHFETLSVAEVAYLLTLFRTSAGSVKPFWVAAAHSLDAGARVYGRAYGDKLSINWVARDLAALDWEFLTLPTERTVPAGETFALSIGPTGARWFGYEVVCGGQVWYFTSYESAITGPGGHVFLPQQISHGTIVEEINLVSNDCDLEVHAWSGCPFNYLVQQLAADPLIVTIFEGTLAVPGDALPIYTGTAMAPRTSAQRMTVKLRGPGAVLGTQGPRFLMQETCSAVLGDARCALAGGVPHMAASLLNLNGVAGGVALAGLAEVDTTDPVYVAAKYFRNGYAERTINAHVQRLMIADSYALDNGKLGLVFGSTVTPVPTFPESGWVFYAGCDGLFDTCHAKFANRANFRGCPRMPRVNPTIIPLSSSTTGKKT